MKEPKPPSTNGLDVSVAAWGVALFFGARIVAIVLDTQAMAAAVAQAVLAEWGASRLGVVWSPSEPPPSAADTARRISRGVAVGLGVGLFALVFALVTGSTRVGRVDHVEVAVLGIGLVTAALHAWRDELLQHGILLRALPWTLPPPLRVVGCGVVSAGAALAASHASAQSVLIALLLGTVSGALWIHGRGAWQPWAASTMARFTLSTLLNGGLLDVRLSETATAFGLAPAAVAAIFWAVREQRVGGAIAPPPTHHG